MDGWVQWAGWAAPAAYGLGFVLALALRARAWPIAATASLAALAGSAAAAGLQAAAHARGDGPVDAAGAVVAFLIALLGWVIVRYSRQYLDGEPGQARYAAALQFTLAAAFTVVLAPHLGLLVAAWVATSIGLHVLLTFYRDRAAAQVAAHKKFLASRMAEACLLVALALIYGEAGTLWLDDIAAHVGRAQGLAPSLHAAAALIALAAILKSAQLPLHGWLIQVMEAPTPVSALLHAGIVNLGGFVLIRLAVLLSAAPAAQALLVVVGSVTAVLAGLVMMTRISIKVRLAWSTCAQMGFMLMECGLGLYDLALLHLVAHSFYKAHAFLTAGDAVAEARRRDLEPAPAATDGGAFVAQRLLALPAGVALVAASVWAWRAWLPELNLPSVAIVIAGLGLAPLLWPGAGSAPIAVLRGTLRVLALSQLYLLWHLVFAQFLPPVAPLPVLAAWACLCFALLAILQVWLLGYPAGALAARCYPWAYAGFYLDERFTRFTFRLWPVRVRTDLSGETS
jgi:NAD(P)H-quinone oxidoreductase subunit 5